MIKGRKYHKAGNNYDEYYTTIEEVEFVFNTILDENFKDKILYCPFDGEESAFVKYIKEHKEIGYKELWFTSDDFKNHEDLIEKADVIISNPPFSLLIKEILPMMKKYNKKFFLFGSIGNIEGYIRIYKPYEVKYMRRGEFKFIMSHINEQTGDYWCYVACTLYMTNLGVKESFKQMKPNKKFLSKSFDEIEHVYDQDGVLTIDKMMNFPNDYYDIVRAPVTLLEHKYMKYVEFIEREKMPRDNYSDGKSRYLRFYFRRKK